MMDDEHLWRENDLAPRMRCAQISLTLVQTVTSDPASSTRRKEWRKDIGHFEIWPLF